MPPVKHCSEAVDERVPEQNAKLALVDKEGCLILKQELLRRPLMPDAIRTAMSHPQATRLPGILGSTPHHTFLLEKQSFTTDGG